MERRVCTNRRSYFLLFTFDLKKSTLIRQNLQRVLSDLLHQDDENSEALMRVLKGSSMEVGLLF